ncbi:hypothetical protein [Bordetella sp. FB-8]|uniref:hypothetical protein n=1 Tax=Bordetella sp. FB-8 TaxID=1159870 RepID=UPI0003657E47|nr:hypothetical protein [Bordetella sp. FB-8]
MASVTTFPLPDNLARERIETGWALAAISGNQIAAVREFRRLSPQVAQHLPIGAEQAAEVIRRWLDTLPASSVVDELQQLGRITVGMCHEGQFLEC